VFVPHIAYKVTFPVGVYGFATYVVALALVPNPNNVYPSLLPLGIIIVSLAVVSDHLAYKVVFALALNAAPGA